VLILCAAAEVNLHFEILFSYAQNDVTKKRPTVDLIMRLFCEGRAENLRCRFLFSSDSPLFRHSLIRFVEEPEERQGSFLTRSVKTEERIVTFLLDQPLLDVRLRAFTALLQPSREFSSLCLPERFSRELRSAASLASNDGGIFLFHGPNGVGKQSAAE